MKSNHTDMSGFIGFRVNRNIYNRFSVLLLPAGSVLTKKEIDLFQEHKITIKEEDVEKVSIRQLVNSTIDEIRDTFGKVRDTGKIPLEHIESKVVPLIIEMSQHPELNRILSQLQEHDIFTYRHSIGVSILTRMIGKLKGFSPSELHELTVAGFLHDIGKAKIPDRIINKAGKLTPDEFALIKLHPVYGYDIMIQSPGITRRQALVALQHHERQDGSGYPNRLAGPDIDLYSKIVAVADVFHAMISRRPYKEPLPFHRVIQEMSENVYGFLEPDVTLPFIRRIMDMMIGNEVLLSNGSLGKIIMIPSDDPVHPVVEVKGSFIDLRRTDTIRMEQIV